MIRPDQSMHLLSDLQADALEPGYRANAGIEVSRSPWLLGGSMVVLAALLVLAAFGSFRSSSELATERSDLLSRVTEGQQRQSDLEAQVRALREENRTLESRGLTNESLRLELALLGPVVGDVPVKGPGVVILIDDARGTDKGEGLVYDTDLVRLVNGLWQSGAEAVAINGRRLSALTPIRSAGSAITVDYVSLSPPYRVEAIGDPETLPARFARTAASVWWKYISDNYGVGFDMRPADGQLSLAADPGMTVRYARK